MDVVPGVLTRDRIECAPVYVAVFFRKHIAESVSRPSGTVEHAPEHLRAERYLKRLAPENCSCVVERQARCSLEHLEYNLVAFHLYDSSDALCAVLKSQLRDLFVSDSAHSLEADERTVYFRKSRILDFHSVSRPLSQLYIPPIVLSISRSYASNISGLSFGMSYFIFISLSKRPVAIMSVMVTPFSSASQARS